LPAQSPVVTPSSGDAALSEKLQPLNVKKQIFQTIGFLLLAPALFVLFLSRAGMVDGGLTLGLGVLGGILGAICLYISNSYGKEKKALISKHVIQGVLEENFELVKYAPLESFSEEQLRISQLRGWNKFKGNDFFQAKYKNVSFQFSDVWLGRSRANRLKGQWLILDLYREIPAPLIISELERRGDLGRKARVQLEQTPFSDRFTVLTESPDSIPKILTPEFIEYLLTADDQSFYNGQHLFFMGKQAHYGINSELDLFEPCDNVQNIPALRERVQEEIDHIKRIIDGFLLIEGLFQGAETEDDR